MKLLHPLTHRVRSPRRGLRLDLPVKGHGSRLFDRQISAIERRSRFGSRIGSVLRCSAVFPSSWVQRRLCGSSVESGSVGLGIAAVGMAVLLVAAVGSVGAGVSAYTKAAAGADAAALAAAPVTFRPFGAPGSPQREAAAFAAANGSRLLRCRCPIDRSWAPRSVKVTVARTVSILGIGQVTVRASSRATFDPSKLLDR